MIFFFLVFFNQLEKSNFFLGECDQRVSVFYVFFGNLWGFFFLWHLCLNITNNTVVFFFFRFFFFCCDCIYPVNFPPVVTLPS